MYRRILVPLDGSKLAECVLPHVAVLAKGCNTEEVILVSVTERLTGRTRAPEISELSHTTGEVTLPVGKMERQAQRYLRRIAKKLQAKGITVQTKVLLGKPAEEIAAYAEDAGCELIVMASHGRSGLSRWAFGSVADKVFRASRIPILMVRAPGYVSGV